jgi:hypothetical protein
MPQTQTSIPTCNKPMHPLLIGGPICTLAHSNGSHSNGRFYWEDELLVSANDLTSFLLAIQKLPSDITMRIQLNTNGSVTIMNIDAFVQITK